METHIKTIIERFFVKSKEKFTVYQRIDAVLNAVIDSDTRQYVSIKEVRGRTLILQAGSSSASYNLTLQKEKILAAVKNEIASISDIVIRVG